MSVRVVGLDEIKQAFAEIVKNLNNLEIATSQLARLMGDYVHVDSGDLRDSIDFEDNIAFADTPYAGVEEERGGSHAYATQAIDAFDLEAYADAVLEPF